MSARVAGTTKGTIRNHRLLEHLLPLDVSQVEYNRAGGNQQRACEIRRHSSGIQSTYPGRRKPEPA